MPSALAGFAPNLDKYLKSLKGQPLELTIDSLISCVLCLWHASGGPPAAPAGEADLAPLAHDMTDG